MKFKRMTAAVCALALAAGMAGAPAGDVFGADTAITASAEDRIVLGRGGVSEDDFEYDGDIGYIVNDDGTVDACYYKGTAKELIIPSKLNGKTVSEIGLDAFPNDVLTSITVPASVKSISNYAFSFTTNLKSINVESGNKYYRSIDGVLYDKDVTTLIKCPRTKDKLTIPDSVKSIGDEAVFRCNNLTSVVIPNSVTSIDGSAFAYCENMTSVTIPNSVKNIEGSAFYGCVSLTSVTIPNSVTNIDDYSFRGCTSLTSVVIPNSVTSIGENAFFNTNLKTVTIPSSVTSIGEGSFKKCPNVVIKCYAGTAAEKYAKENGVKYELIDSGTSSAETDISKATAKFSATKISYTGKSKMPKLTVTMDGKTLVKGRDYKVSGKNCKNPGKATITIKGIGNYTGTKTMNFYIVPAKPTVTKATSTAKKKITLAWRKDTLADGYQVVVYSNKACTKKVKSALVKKNTTVGGSLSGFTSGRTYYVRVRAYKTIDGSKKAGAFSAVKTVKVK